MLTNNMPILERDPWRYQFFEGVDCPSDVLIPTDDPDCWALSPHHRWIYDKLRVAESQGLVAGPHGVLPPHYPVFSKPIVNLKGMGVGSRVLRSPQDYEQYYVPGHMWMPLLTGDHVSTDCAVEDGHIAWSRHATGEPWHEGMFKYWTVHAAPRPALDEYLGLWVEGHMTGYTGMMNFETIGGVIIEAHLRFADQWCDLYGPGWNDALVRLYRDGHWHLPDEARTDGFSVPLFARHGNIFHHPPERIRQDVLAMPGVKSLQLTFHEARSLDDHPMPPGGFRLTIVNGTDLEACFEARRLLARHFSSPDIMLPD
jgi:hypothetical protein